jgi:phosphoribosylformylglycinamidine synthase subunit II (EC 6.3.5.3)
LIYFDDSYVGNCLVNVGCIGIMKKENLVRSRVDSSNDVFILAGGKLEGMGSTASPSPPLISTQNRKRPADPQFNLEIH